MITTHLVMFKFTPGATLHTGGGGGRAKDRIIKLRRQRAYTVRFH